MSVGWEPTTPLNNADLENTLKPWLAALETEIQRFPSSLNWFWATTSARPVTPRPWASSAAGTPYRLLGHIWGGGGVEVGVAARGGGGAAGGAIKTRQKNAFPHSHFSQPTIS